PKLQNSVEFYLIKSGGIRYQTEKAAIQPLFLFFDRVKTPVVFNLFFRKEYKHTIVMSLTLIMQLPHKSWQPILPHLWRRHVHLGCALHLLPLTISVLCPMPETLPTTSPKRI